MQIPIQKSIVNLRCHCIYSHAVTNPAQINNNFCNDNIFYYNIKIYQFYILAIIYCNN